MSGRLHGKIAVVTAAGRGLGRGMALELARAGADVVVNSYSEQTTGSTASAITALNRRALPVAGDVTDPDVIQTIVARAMAEFGRIDILINNVGAGPKVREDPQPGPLGVIAARWDDLYRQNLRSIVLMSEAVVPQLVAQQSGKIINIASIAARSSLPKWMIENLVPNAYSAMKAGVISYTRSLAELHGTHNITANAICPGIVWTDDWLANAEKVVTTIPEFKDQDPREWFLGIARGDYPAMFDRTPMRREQTVEDIGRAAVFLASDDAQNITGQTLMVDGGQVMV